MDSMQDITAQAPVEVEIRADGTVLWVHVNGITVLRICRISDLQITDHRKEELMHTDGILIEDKFYTCHHNGDWSGNVVIYPMDEDDHREKLAKDPDYLASKAIVIPFDLMAELVGRSIIDDATTRLEHMTGREAVETASIRA